MKNNTIITLLTIASAGLTVAALIFIGICIFSENEASWLLPAALGCVALSGLFNIIRHYQKKEK